jgi:transposase
MKFYTGQHRYYCGIDLHAKTMYVCVLDGEGRILVHRNISSTPQAFLEILEPYRADVAVAVECMFTWYWLADLCAAEKIHFVLGHALYMKAIHGGKAKNDKIDAHKIAVLLRGGMLPQAYVYPPEMRATRDLLRRRLHFVRKRGELLAHIENTKSQYNLPDFSARLNRAVNRKGIAEHFPDPCVRRSIETDLDLIDYYDTLIGKIEWHIMKAAKQKDEDLLLRLRSIPGIGPVLSLTIFYEVHDIHRFPRVQDFVSYSRLVKCAKESAGKRLGTGGSKIGNVHLKWAFSEATALFLRHNSKGKAYLQRMIHKHGKPKALSILAHKLGRTVYYMMARRQTFDMERFYQG